MSEEQIQKIVDLLHSVDKKQAVLITRFDEHLNTHARMSSDAVEVEERIDQLEETVKPIGWIGQSKTLLLWVVALFGGVVSALKVLDRL